MMPRLDHGDVNYDRASNESCHQSLESLHYRAAIAVSWAIRERSSEKPSFLGFRPRNPKIKRLTN